MSVGEIRERPFRYPKLPPVDEVFTGKELIGSDGMPMDTGWHVVAMNLLFDVLCYYSANVQEGYVAANMFIYYRGTEGERRKFRGPDVFFVRGASRMPLRKYWVVDKEGNRFPNFILELTSPWTAKVDRTTKKNIYEKTFRTPNYVCYDPRTQEFLVWHLQRGKYRPVEPNGQGRYWIEELGMWLGTWGGSYVTNQGVFPRFFQTDGSLLPTFNEAAEQLALRQAQAAELAERRVDALEEELANLKERTRHDNKKR